MSIYLSEEEQIQKIKDWWKQYGTTILLVLAVFLGGNFGWKYWQQHKNNRTEQASIIYEQLVTSYQKQQIDEFNLYAKHLKDDYTNTPYAAFASFLQAKEAVSTNKLQEAQQNYDWVIQHTSNKELKQIAKIREARVLAADNQQQKALELLEKIDDNTFAALVHETKGDILISMNNSTAALGEYKIAEEVSAPDHNKNMIELKINGLLK